MKGTERGTLLPVVLVVSLVLYILLTITIAEFMRMQQLERLYNEMIQAQYAAESGIAYTEQTLSQQDNLNITLRKRFGAMEVITKARSEDSEIISITATAYARLNVKQTVTVYVKKDRYTEK